MALAKGVSNEVIRTANEQLHSESSLSWSCPNFFSKISLDHQIISKLNKPHSNRFRIKLFRPILNWRRRNRSEVVLEGFFQWIG